MAIIKIIANNLIMIIEYHWSVIRRAFTDATCMVYRTGGGVTGLDTLKGDIFFLLGVLFIIPLSFPNSVECGLTQYTTCEVVHAM